MSEIKKIVNDGKIKDGKLLNKQYLRSNQLNREIGNIYNHLRKVPHKKDLFIQFFEYHLEKIKHFQENIDSHKKDNFKKELESKSKKSTKTSKKVEGDNVKESDKSN